MSHPAARDLSCAAVRWILGLLLVVALGDAALASPPSVAERFDVIVTGSEPEAIAAAAAAAETGARTVLVTPDARLGGLFTLGSMTVLDVRTTPVSMQQGWFARWWERVGGGHAFDPERAERTFEAMLHEAGVEVRKGVRGLRIEVEAGAVVGASWEGGAAAAPVVIDADQDLTFAVAAGASASEGWSGWHVELRMADTLSFRIDGVDWDALRAAAQARGRSWATVDDRVAWGHFGGEPAAFRSSDPTLRLRGLNLGRDDHGRVWVNALLIHGVDWRDPASRLAARLRAASEAERVVDHLRERLPGFADARLGAVAERLYLRETRHLAALCVLDADHLLDGRVGAMDVAVGGYPLDLQALTPNDTGFVFGTPRMYGVPLCATVPEDGPTGLFAVGRSAGYDPVAHSSVRVVPMGIAIAEGVGVAAALLPEGRTTAWAALDPAFLQTVRSELRARGAYLPAPREDAPVGPVDHPHFGAFRLMLSRGLALGGYDNRPELDASVPLTSHLYLLANVAQRWFADPEAARALVASYAGVAGPAGASEVARVQRSAACRLGLDCPAEATPAALAAVGLWPASVPTSGTLARGQSYELAAALLRSAGFQW